jgi:myo-inositol-1(or 4)-monophosphatase
VLSVDDLAVALEAARSGAAAIRRHWSSAARPDFKGEVDPVTTADRASEAAVLEVIRRRRPGEPFLGEEGGARGGQPGPRLWVADPLDGTVNFIHGIPHCAVSVALQDDQGTLAAATIDVARGEEFTAARGGGARLDGHPLGVSPTADLGRALLSTGFPYDRRVAASAYTAALTAALGSAQGVRRLGAACLDLAWVAAGRYDGHWEFGLAPWDIAAGCLLITEAGGRVTDSRGGPPRPEDIVASNGLIHQDLVALVAPHRPAHLPSRPPS